MIRETAEGKGGGRGKGMHMFALVVLLIPVRAKRQNERNRICQIRREKTEKSEPRETNRACTSSPAFTGPSIKKATSSSKRTAAMGPPHLCVCNVSNDGQSPTIQTFIPEAKGLSVHCIPRYQGRVHSLLTSSDEQGRPVTKCCC